MKDAVIKIGIYFLFIIYVLPILINLTSLGFCVILFSLLLAGSATAIGVKSGALSTDNLDNVNLTSDESVKNALSIMMFIVFGIFTAAAMSVYFLVALISPSFALTLLLFATVDAVYSDLIET